MGCNSRAEEEEARRHRPVTVTFIENNVYKVETTTAEGAILAQYLREKFIRQQEMELKELQTRWMEQQGGGKEGGSVCKRPRPDDLVESSESLEHLPDSSIAAYDTAPEALGQPGGSVFKHFRKYLTRNHPPTPTGTKSKAKGESVRTDSHQDLGDSSEAFVESQNHSAYSSIAARGGSIFKRLRRYLIGELHETQAWNSNPAADL